jgi:hypothetical protein
LLVGTAVSLVLVAPSHAKSFHVNDNAFIGDAHPGDGKCDTGYRSCTLRAAIEEANKLPGPDIILLPAGTYPTHALIISDDLKIVGQGTDKTFIGYCDQVPPANPDPLYAPVFFVEPSVKVNILDVTITECHSVFIGCIYSERDLTISYSKVTGCDSDGGVGAIRNENNGSLTIENSEISHSGAGDGYSGCISNVGDLKILDSTITDCYSRLFGAIYNDGNLTIKYSEISHGRAGGGGGGIVSVGSEGGNLSISYSKITGNVGYAGGIWYHGEGTATIAYSEITGNYGGQGAGIRNDGIMTVKYSKVSQNNGWASVFNYGNLTINYSEITGNLGDFPGIWNGGNLIISYSEITDNYDSSGQELDIYNMGTVKLKYTIVGTCIGCQ